MNSPPQQQKILISYFFGDNAIPLGASCARALAALGFSLRYFDSGRTSPVYQAVLKPTGKLLRLVGFRRGEPFAQSYWGDHRYRERLLAEAVREFRPDILLVIRGHGFSGDFVARLKSSYGIRKTVCWWVKGPKWFELMHEERPFYDHYFCIHNEGYSAADGIVPFTALAVDDLLYRKLDSAECGADVADIVFVGGWSKGRQALMEQISDLPLAIYGPKWRKKNLFNRSLLPNVKQTGIWGDELVRLYNRTKIALNISQWDTSRLSGLNLRIFDIPACGTFLLTDYSDQLREYFILGEEIETFKNAEEMRDKILYYLKNAAPRERIAARGYDKVKRLGSYRDKMERMFATVLADDTDPEARWCEHSSGGGQ